MINYERNNNEMSRQQHAMLSDIQKLQFVVLDLALFLDTHPNDPVAIYRHNAYATQLKKYREAYETQYGPMSIMTADMGDTWRYINSPWPWEM
ncbi:MAG: spore coat protein CotJB [Sedimentibacter sp.]